MGGTGVLPPFLALGLFIALFSSVIYHVQAQLPPGDPCGSGAGITVSISFNELDPTGVSNNLPQTVSEADRTYSVTVVDDPSNLTPKYPFNQFFSCYFNDATNKWTVDIIQAIDRDGSLPENSDDVNILQYQLRCKPPGVNDVIYSILKIVNTDVNDNSPELKNLPYFADVNELTPHQLP